MFDCPGEMRRRKELTQHKIDIGKFLLHVLKIDTYSEIDFRFVILVIEGAVCSFSNTFII